MKSISIYALTRKQNIEHLQKLEQQLSGREHTLKLKEWELESMRALVDQLELQPVDPVVTTHRNTAGRDSRQEAEYGCLRHQVPRLLTIVPHRRSRHPPARQISCRIGAVAHAEAEAHRYEC